MPMSLGDYAASRGISYEAVRKQVNRHKDSLEGHITKQGKKQLLDDEAVAYLDEHRLDKVVLMQPAVNDEVQRLEAENKALLMKVAQLQDIIIQKGDQILELQQAKHDLESKVMLLEAAHAEPEEPAQEPHRGFWRRLFKG